MAITAWLEVCLFVDGELAEAVAEVLARFAPEGVVIESTAVTANADDSQGHAVGPLRVCAYLPADENLEDVRQRLEEALWYLGRIRPLPEAQYQLVQQADWAEAWKQYYHPVKIGERLMIVPAWLEIDTGGRVPVHMDPGMAFGTGTHPTTQLCLELLEEFYRDTGSGAETVIDVGCGSGILAVAALKLGAMHALGVDLDAEAINASQQNAALNGVAGRLEVGLGSVAEIQSGAFTLRQAPLVMANILAPVIIRLLGDGLAELLVPGGSLVLSGILAEQCGDVEGALQEHGLRRVERRQEGDWVALLAQ
jgi:ribosomal protein L11 methyltransferase